MAIFADSSDGWSEHSSNDLGELADSLGQLSLAARGYQVEMFELSMQSNTIVCMETGSGKTLIAMLRIQAELQRNPSKVNLSKVTSTSS